MRSRGILLSFLLLLVFVMPTMAQEDGPTQVGLRPDAPQYALHGPYWVGTMGFIAATPSHPTMGDFWYPALNPTGETEDTTYEWGYDPYVGIITGHALRDATPNLQNGPYPLVVISHGWEGGHLGYTYLSEHLASRGFVVMAIDHADNVGTMGTVPQYTTLYTRPQDISWAIDYADTLNASGENLAGMIDLQQVAVVGHSHGGWTAVAVAGGQLQMSWLNQIADVFPTCFIPEEMGGGNWCTPVVEHQQDLANLAGLEVVPEDLWPSWGDERVDAIVGLSPAAGYFGPEGLKGVSVPAMFLIGSEDTAVSPEVDAYQVYENLGSEQKSMITLQNADHMISFWKCSDGPFMTDDFGAYWVCSDPVWDMDRAHDLIDHFTTAFLLDVLKGDMDAHTALLAENVSFPGITYETTMK